MTPAPNRFSLMMSMAFVGVIALGLGGMRLGSDLAAKVAFNLTLLTLLVGLLGAIVRLGGAAWVGFALFGWSHALLAFVPASQSVHENRLATMILADLLATRLHPEGPGPQPPTFPSGYRFELSDWRRPYYLGAGFEIPGPTKVLSPEEWKLVESYPKRVDESDARGQFLGHSIANAAYVGNALFTMAFALLGALLGKLLARPWRPPAELDPAHP